MLRLKTVHKIHHVKPTAILLTLMLQHAESIFASNGLLEPANTPAVCPGTPCLIKHIKCIGHYMSTQSHAYTVVKVPYILNCTICSDRAVLVVKVSLSKTTQEENNLNRAIKAYCNSCGYEY